MKIITEIIMSYDRNIMLKNIYNITTYNIILM